jgi:hypothetical protein
MENSRLADVRPLLLLLGVLGCGNPPVKQPLSDTKPAESTRAVSSVQRSGAHELVQRKSLPTALGSTCDSVAAFMHDALGLDVSRDDGDYFDSFQGTERLGCRLTTEGSFKTLKNPAGPVGAVENAMRQAGWRPDLRYGGEGPDGSNVGLRRLDMLCLITGQWDGGDDSDTITVAPTEEESRFKAIAECAKDVASNDNSGVPDSMWRIAREAGLDSVYAISLRLQYPPYLNGDFDGDGVADAAVLVEHRATGKTGLAIMHRGTHRVTILGAGKEGPGPADLTWVDRLDVFPQGTTYHLTIGDRPSIQLGADALWVGREDSVSAFYVWTGANFIWELHNRR